MHSLLYPAQAASDQRWFDRILPCIDELYISLGIPRQQLAEMELAFQKTPFNPDLRPLHHDVGLLERRNDQLAGMRIEIEQDEPHAAVRQAYHAKIDELIAQNELLIAAIHGDSERLQQLNSWLFGSPDPAVFSAICAWIRREAEAELKDGTGHISQAAASVLTLLPDLTGDIHTLLPDSHVFKQVRDSHFKPGGYFESLFGGTDIPEMVTSAEGDEPTKRAISNVGSAYQLKDSTDYLWGVIHGDHAVVRPVDYTLSKAGFIGIVSHEVGSHLLERENGLRQPLRLLSVGLDRYESSNEGRAFLREQIQFHSPYEMMNEQSWEHIILLYLSAALGAGIYRQPYDFIALHEVVFALCHMFKARRMPDNPVIAARQAQEEAWQITTRAAKGTAGTGGAFNKGMVYLSGNLQAWQLAVTDPNVIFLGDAGKFDISRQDHRDILAAFDIISR